MPPRLRAILSGGGPTLPVNLTALPSPVPCRYVAVTMHDILARLLDEEKNRCEEETRKLILNLCALGAMCTMQDRHADAAAQYIEVR